LVSRLDHWLEIFSLLCAALSVASRRRPPFDAVVERSLRARGRLDVWEATRAVETSRAVATPRLRIWGSGVRISSGAPANIQRYLTFRDHLPNQAQTKISFSLGFSLGKFFAARPPAPWCVAKDCAGCAEAVPLSSCLWIRIRSSNPTRSAIAP
jgi:hypothetical protein